MKRLLIYMFLFLPLMSLSISAQDYILRAGNVYKYNKKMRRWSHKPLPLKSPLNRNDIIKSKSNFTIEIPLSLFNVFSKRIYTYGPTDTIRGVRLNEDLKEITDAGRSVPTGVVPQGGIEVEYLAWILQNRNSTIPSSVNVDFELCNANNGSQIEGTTIPLSTPVNLTVINNEPFEVYAYVFWKDNSKWSYFHKPAHTCYHISPFSSYDLYKDKGKYISFSEPIGLQQVWLICSKDIISSRDTDLLLTILNDVKNTSFSYDVELKTIGVDVKCFNLTK